MCNLVCVSACLCAATQNVLKAWSQLGAQDPEKLRALLVERRLKTFRGLLLQTVLDFVACGGGFYIGKVSSESNIPGSIIFSLLGYFLACYYFLQAVFQVTALTSISVAAKRYATDTDVLLAAVRELAGPEPGLFPSASLVVNTLKVIQTLEQIGERLQVRVSSVCLCVFVCCVLWGCHGVRFFSAATVDTPSNSSANTFTCVAPAPTPAAAASCRCWGRMQAVCHAAAWPTCRPTWRCSALRRCMVLTPVHSA